MASCGMASGESAFETEGTQPAPSAPGSVSNSYCHRHHLSRFLASLHRTVGLKTLPMVNGFAVWDRRLNWTTSGGQRHLLEPFGMSHLYRTPSLPVLLLLGRSCSVRELAPQFVSSNPLRVCRMILQKKGSLMRSVSNGKSSICHSRKWYEFSGASIMERSAN